MSNSKDEENSFSVKDKRRFDEDGNKKSAEEASPVVEQKEEVVEKVEASPAVEGDEAVDPELNFSSFVMSLATQALMLMGEVPVPDNMPIKKDFKSAKQTIDIIKMLNQKTKGNLDSNEEHLVTEILHSLRMAFLKHT